MTEKITDAEMEELRRWKAELDELDSSAFSGPPVTEESFKKSWDLIMSGNHLKERLKTVQRSKEKTLLKLAKLEEIEEALKEEIAKEQETSQV
ncbi:MAG: hypothetical protein KME64_15205 [Scytonematopsis contorta HA4267-MV1]|jgi:hypothetical protein|nr:hypothetical protein [Scytonematopsis contorta HA4267-MV1]